MRVLVLIQIAYLFQYQPGVQGKCKFTRVPKGLSEKDYFYCPLSRTWEEAKQECANNGWTLINIKSENESVIFENFFNSSERRPHVWTGLKLFENYTTREQLGYWSDGSIFYFRNDGIDQKNESYAAWHRLEPKEEQDLCVHLLWKKMKYVWDNWKCSMKRTFFCESTGYQETTPRPRLGFPTPTGTAIAKNRSEPIGRTKSSDIDYSILKDIDNLPATRVNTEAIMTVLDEVLAKRHLAHTYPSDAKESRDVVRAFHDFISRYLEKDVFVTRSTVDVTVNISTAQEPLTYKVFGKSGNDISLHLDTNLLQEAIQKSRNFNYVQVGSIAYRSSKLFQTDDTLFNDTVQKNEGKGHVTVQRVKATGMFGENAQVRLRPHLLSDIISSEVSNVSLKDLRNKLRVTIQLDCKDQPERKELHELVPTGDDVRCAFWNVEDNTWSTNGCRVVRSSGKCHNWRYPGIKKIDVTCECDHMTHFAAIFDTGYTYAPVYVGYLNMISCIISAFFLLLSVIAILSFRHMREDMNKRIILNIAINLFVVNLIFVIGIDGRKTPSLCMATSFILHYFTLTSWSWMLIEALHLLLTLSLLDRNGAWRKYVLLISGILAYVFPGVIAAVAVTVFERYTSVKYCWIAPNVAIYTLAIPIGAVLVVNIAVAVYTIYKMTCGLKLRNVRKSRAWINKSIKRSLCLAFLLGVPWTFGMLMLLCQTPKSKDVFATIFAICNIFQGVIIFVAFCAMDEKFRTKVLKICSSCTIEIAEKLPTLASYTMKPAAKQRKMEKQSAESTPGTPEIPSRKTTATIFSPSPLIENRKVNPTLTDIESVEKTLTPEDNQASIVVSDSDEITDDGAGESGSVGTSARNSTLSEQVIEVTDVAAEDDENIRLYYQHFDLGLYEKDIIINTVRDETCETATTITAAGIEAKPAGDGYDKILNAGVVVEISQQSEYSYATQTRCEMDIVTSYLGNATERPFRSGWV